jgi:pyrophosphatase PpaX
MKPYRTVLFDLDGTLLDTVDMIVASVRHALAEHLRYDPGRALAVAGIGMPLVEQLGGHAARAGARVDDVLMGRLVQSYLSHNHAVHDEAVRAYPGVEDALEQLRARGTRLGIVTSKARGIADRGLRLCGLRDYFEVLVGSEDVDRHKPDPAPVFEGLRRMGLPVAGTVFVGDSPYDVRAGRAAGVSTGAALWGPFPRADLDAERPTYAFSRVADVLAHVI